MDNIDENLNDFDKFTDINDKDEKYQIKLNNFYNKIHNLDIYSLIKRKSNVDNNLDKIRNSIYKIIKQINKDNIYDVINNLNTEYNNEEIKVLILMFYNLLNYEINILDIILLLYDMEFKTLENFIRYFNIQIIKLENNINDIKNFNLEKIIINNNKTKLDYLNSINIYSNKNNINTILIINYLKKYCFPNHFIL
jgi:hypothetical protein